VTAVAPVVIEWNGTWVGWSGLSTLEKDEVIPESSPNDQGPTAGLKSAQVRPVVVDPKIFDLYYNG